MITRIGTLGIEVTRRTDSIILLVDGALVLHPSFLTRPWRHTYTNICIAQLRSCFDIPDAPFPTLSQSKGSFAIYSTHFIIKPAVRSLCLPVSASPPRLLLDQTCQHHATHTVGTGRDQTLLRNTRPPFLTLLFSLEIKVYIIYQEWWPRRL